MSIAEDPQLPSVQFRKRAYRAVIVLQEFVGVERAR